MNSYDFFIYEFICFMNSYMNSGVPRFHMMTNLNCSSILPAQTMVSQAQQVPCLGEAGYGEK